MAFFGFLCRCHFSYKSVFQNSKITFFILGFTFEDSRNFSFWKNIDKLHENVLEEIEISEWLAWAFTSFTPLPYSAIPELAL